jgi:hypothetical protein
VFLLLRSMGTAALHMPGMMLLHTGKMVLLREALAPTRRPS